MNESSSLRDEALQIWQAAIRSVRPAALMQHHAQETLKRARESRGRILVVGGGKAGGSMAEALEEAIPECLDRVEGIINVPDDNVRTLRKIQLHAARPAGSNHPTERGVLGAGKMLDLLAQAGPDDIGICLLSGGGSALLPAPVDGISLADKQALTKLLHGCGASINEMNCVRKHLSRLKGGNLAKAFQGQALYSLIISDVVGDPLEVIASGPTAVDPSTFAEAIAVIERYQLRQRVQPAIVRYLESGVAGLVPETMKELPANIHNVVIGNNQTALHSAAEGAEKLGYRVVNLGSFVEGETREVAVAVAGIVRSIRRDCQPLNAPACILIGGETTVRLRGKAGKGGRNQEFVLALLHKLGREGMEKILALSGGTDGEDGPTDAAGAFADAAVYKIVVEKFGEAGIAAALDEHNSYPLWEAVGGLIRTGLTETNVMDVRIILIN